MAANRKAAWVTICVALCSGAEGLRQTAYRDVTGVPTICFGETRGVHMGDTATKAECEAMLEGRLYEFAAEVDRCCPACSATPQRKAAYVDLFYNFGATRACRFQAVNLQNAGNVREGCDDLLNHNTAGGVVFPGLTKRREKERELCLMGN